jgi:hypothetical protein
LIALLMPFVKRIASRLCKHAIADPEGLAQDTLTVLLGTKLNPTLTPSLFGLIRTIAVRTHSRRRGNLDGPTIGPAYYLPTQISWAELSEVLARIFGKHAPHQALACVFCELLEFHPREIVRRYADHDLESLSHEFVALYSHDAMPIGRLKEVCAPLFRAMPRMLDDVLTDPKMRDTYAPLLARRCGATSLRDYQTGNLTDNIAKWCYSAKRSLRKWQAGAPLV